MIVNFTDRASEGFATGSASPFQGIKEEEAFRLINIINAVTCEDDALGLSSVRAHRMTMSTRNFLVAEVGRGWKLKFRVWGSDVHDVQIMSPDQLKGLSGTFSPRSRTHRIKAVHPGVILAEEMQARNMTSGEAGCLLRADRSLIEDVVKRTAPVTADLAVRLGAHFGAVAEFWMNLQARHDLQRAQERYELSPHVPLLR